MQLLHHPTRRVSLTPEGETYLLDGYPLPCGAWHPRQGDQQQTVKVRGMLSTNDGETATRWALEVPRHIAAV